MDFATHPPVSGGQPVALHAGQVLAGRYRVSAFLGSGSVGEVYEAEDLELGERIALKILNPAADDEPLLRRFKQEIQLARRVTHPNVCRTYDLAYHCEEAGVLAGAPPRLRVFLTMELLRGETLADRLARHGRMAPEEALTIVRQVAAALTAAHAAGVVHRDLKSGNIFLVATPAGLRAVVTDFGLAGTSGETSASGELMGSPAYMAPEQVRNEAVTPATDVYALGVVLYEMITGELPFIGTSAFYTAVKRLKEPPPAPRGKVPALDPAWNAAILRCLEREPADRFAAADDVIAALTPCAAPPAVRPLSLPRRAVWGRIAACLLFFAIGSLALLVPPIPIQPPGSQPVQPVQENVELRNRLIEILARERERGDIAAEAKTQRDLAHLFQLQGDLPTALRGYRRLATLLRDTGDRRGLAEALQNMASIAYDLGDPEGARGAWEESLSLSRRAGNQAGVAASLHGLAGIDRLGGKLAAAQAKYEEAFALYSALRQPLQEASMLHEIGRLYVLRHEPQRALEVFARALDVCGAPDCPLQAAALNDIGKAYRMLGDPRTSRANHERSLALSRASHNRTEEARALVGLGDAALELAEPRTARGLFLNAFALFHQLGNRNRETDALSGIARTLAAEGDYQGALSKFRESRSVRLELGEPLFANDNLLAIAELALAFDRPTEAAAAAREAARVYRELGVPLSEAKATAVLSRCQIAGRFSL